MRFGVVYGFTALSCERGWDSSVIIGVVLGSAALALALNALVVLAGLRRMRKPDAGAAPFLGGLGAAIAALSSLAVVLEAIPTLVLPVCAAP